MPRYIDADKLNKKEKYLFQTQGMPFPKSEWFIKADDLFSAPTADVQEIVRCKYCKHATFYSCKNDACYKSILCDYEIPTDDENFYCAYGERRKEDGEIH